MAITQIVLYLFSLVLVGSSAAVVFSRSAVRAVLFLILAFFNAAGLFILLGAEFLAMVLVIVYVGAVATLFLFVVMMLDVDRVQQREGFSRVLPAGIIVGLVLSAELLFVGFNWGRLAPNVASPADITTEMPVDNELENINAIGNVLYTDYFLLFQLSGIVLLLAMVGAIVLTLSPSPLVRRQNVGRQNARKPSTSVELRSVDPGEGLG